MPTMTMLIGLPGCGKSTFRSLLPPGDHIVASSDDFIDWYAKNHGKTYNDVFKDAIDLATKHYNEMASQAVLLKQNLIIDRTNLTAVNRAKAMAIIPRDWKKVAIAFKFRDHTEWVIRLRSRIGKTIPKNVLADMIDRYEEPSKVEGFDEIYTYYS